MKTTLYQILGVDPKASAQDIAIACDRLAAAIATDGSDPNIPGLVRQAREILLDPGQRIAYDASLAGHPRSPSSDRDVDSESAMRGGWGRWFAAIAVLIGVAAWWGARREAPPAQETRPPQTVSRATRPEPAAPAPDRVRDLPEATEAPRPAEVAAMPALAPRSAEDVFAEVAPSVARVNVMDGAGRNVGTGSGVVIDNEVVLTNCHVAKPGTTLAVKLGDVVMPATVQLADETLDLCRLAVPGLRAPALTIGTVESLRTGQKVYAIGAPAGLELTISEGIVSALRIVTDGTIIQTTAPISPGSSGGGLFDVAGRLVGIMTFQHRFGQNLNFALPADWIGQMRARGTADPAARSRSVAGLLQDRSPASLILGQWLCRDWTSGRTGQYNFEPDGRLSIAMSNNRAVTLNYGVSGKSLRLSDAKQGTTLVIEELTDRRMVFHGSDRSIACERQ